MTGLELKTKLQKELESSELSENSRGIAETMIDMIEHLDRAWTKTLASCKELDAKGAYYKSSILGSNMQQRIFGAIEAMEKIVYVTFPNIKPENAPSIVEVDEKGDQKV